MCGELYWFMGPEYADTNALKAHRPLPPSFWGGPTSMVCMRETIRATGELAYAHHIQRLMVTGNFALLFGLSPHAVNRWYLSVYADAFEWVQLPNTHGMALYADGGFWHPNPTQPLASIFSACPIIADPAPMILDRQLGQGPVRLTRPIGPFYMKTAMFWATIRAWP